MDQNNFDMDTFQAVMAPNVVIILFTNLVRSYYLFIYFILFYLFTFILFTLFYVEFQ